MKSQFEERHAAVICGTRLPLGCFGLLPIWNLRLKDSGGGVEWKEVETKVSL